MRVYRYLGIALLDGLLGWAIYLSSTNRAFITPPAPAERLEFATRIVDNVRSKLQAVSVMRNAILRDDALREKESRYWAHEIQLMGSLMEEREVLDSVNNALESRINMADVERDAEGYSSNVLGPLNPGS